MLGRKRWLFPFFMAALIGCSQASSSRVAPHVVPEAAPASEHVELGCDPRAWDGNFHDTADLVADPELAARVDELAKANVITLQFVSPLIFRRSATWQAASAVFDRATRCDLRALTRHRSAVVRGYVAQQIVDEFPDDVDAVGLLLDDDSHVQSWHERPRADTIACFVQETLETRAKEYPQALALFASAAKDPKLDPAIRASFLKRLGLRHHPEARSIALSVLTEHNETLQESALRSLEDVGTAEDISAIVPFTGTKFGPTGPRIRVAAIAALGGIPARECVDTLPHLLADADVDVGHEAARAYARQPGSDSAIVRRLLADPVFAWSARAGLAYRGDDLAVAVLEPSWMNDADQKYGNPDVDLLLDFERGDKPKHVAVLRRLLDAKSAEVRRWAIYFLGEAHDLESAPRVRAFLHSPDAQARADAARAVGAMGDRDAIPDLTKMVATEDYTPGEQVLEALVALHAREAIPIIEKRESRHEALNPFSFQIALKALRAGTDWPTD